MPTKTTCWFQHTAARRRHDFFSYHSLHKYVSTHSRPKAAEKKHGNHGNFSCVSTHSRPKAAVMTRYDEITAENVSTHSRPKAAGRLAIQARSCCGCFNTQPPEGGCHYVGLIIRSDTVSTHSRPKAAVGSLLVVGQAWAPFQHTAARRRLESNKFRKENVMSFNTQPPEGGWP